MSNQPRICTRCHTPEDASEERKCTQTVNHFGHSLLRLGTCAEISRSYGMDPHATGDAMAGCNGSPKVCIHHVPLYADPDPVPQPEAKCPDALLPDGPVCPRCGVRRGPSGVGGGSWVHWPEPAPPVARDAASASEPVAPAFHGFSSCSHVTLLGDVMTCGPCQDKWAPVATEPTPEPLPAWMKGYDVSVGPYDQPTPAVAPIRPEPELRATVERQAARQATAIGRLATHNDDLRREVQKVLSRCRTAESERDAAIRTVAERDVTIAELKDHRGVALHAGADLSAR